MLVSNVRKTVRGPKFPLGGPRPRSPGGCGALYFGPRSPVAEGCLVAAAADAARRAGRIQVWLEVTGTQGLRPGGRG